MKGYWITLCHVTDSETYGEYIKLAGPAIQKYGGKFLARGGKQVKYEGSSYDRTVVIEFPSFEIAKNYYYSKEYQKAHSFLKGTVVRDLQIVEGS